MKAYKVFDENWKCRGFQYEIGKTYSMKEKPVLCERGFHACVNVADCFNYYSFDPKNKIAEVELLGTVVGGDEDKHCCDKIKILKELTWNEMLVLTNSGKANTGRYNTGHRNTGDSNTGDSNTGHSNTGDSNTGDRNTGDRNTGNWNTGDRNTGNWNTGDRNTGDSNTGDSNTGHSNTGDSNTGHRNTGDSNTGDRNTGDRNTGNWNTGDRNTGYFCTVTPEDILIFNKPCKRSDWVNATKPDFIFITLTEWVYFSDMTDEEKVEYPKAFVCNGYLKSYKYKEAWANSFKNATKKDIELLKSLPNFDAEIFFEISGIRI